MAKLKKKSVERRAIKSKALQKESQNALKKFMSREGKLLLIVLMSIVLSFIFYSRMPVTMVSHWSETGQPNGYMSAFWGSFSIPLLMIFMFLIFYAIPRIDPMKHNIEKFIDYYLSFFAIMLLFVFYLQVLMLAWNMGYRFNMIVMMVPAFFILIFYIGVLLSKAEQNMSIGIRTAWTIKDEEVWNKTHKQAAILVKVASVISLFGIIFVKQAIWFILVPLLAAFLYSVIYSYVIYRRKELESNNIIKKH
jgi:uncharacterized membrane protein